MKLAGLLAVLGLFGLVFARSELSGKTDPHFQVVKTDAQWRKLLTPEQYRVMREKGTEAPFSGKYDHFYQKGLYRCAACGNDLFSSDTKFNSRTGWPSFWAPLSKHSVRTQSDHSDFMDRTEVLCDRCGAHLGHVFDDGPKPTGLRYCMNSVALQFVSREALDREKKHTQETGKPAKHAP